MGVKAEQAAGEALPNKCPECEAPLEVRPEHLGKKVRCVECQAKFVLPRTAGGAFEILEHGEINLSGKGKTLQAGKGKTLQASTGVPRVQSQVPGIKGKDGSGKGVAAAAISAVVLLVGLLVLLGNREEGEAPAEEDTMAAFTPSLDAAEGENAPNPPAETPPAGADAGVPEEKERVAAVRPTPDAAKVSPRQEDLDSAPEQEIEEKKSALTEQQRENALAALCSADKRKRISAYRAFRQLGEKEKEVYESLLRSAREQHVKALGAAALDMTKSRSRLSAFMVSHGEWKRQRDAAKKMVQTNWKAVARNDYQRKHREMDDAFAEAEKSYRRLLRAADRVEDESNRKMQRHLAALAEIDGEIGWCYGEVEVREIRAIDELSSADLAPSYTGAVSALKKVRTIAELREKVGEYNKDLGWARGAKQAFALLLNDRRAALGQTPLHLDEKLSNACFAHSKDMGENNYFSHTGLTPETKTFTIRARRAGFEGGASGECIFKGSASAEAAHRAWWYSDGHRLIMYSDGPNTLGLGVAGTIWTLNTGRMNHPLYR